MGVGLLHRIEIHRVWACSGREAVGTGPQCIRPLAGLRYTVEVSARHLAVNLGNLPGTKSVLSQSAALFLRLWKGANCAGFVGGIPKNSTRRSGNFTTRSRRGDPRAGKFTPLTKLGRPVVTPMATRGRRPAYPAPADATGTSIAVGSVPRRRTATPSRLSSATSPCAAQRLAKASCEHHHFDGHSRAGVSWTQVTRSISFTYPLASRPCHVNAILAGCRSLHTNARF